MEDVFCTCRSHCATFNGEIGVYEGGQFVRRATSLRHRADDNRSTALDDFSRQVASSVLNETRSIGLIHPDNEAVGASTLQTTTLPQIVMTIEGEIRERVSWTATSKPLFFASDPISDSDFDNPLASSSYIPNSGKHALDPSNPQNIAFIENESRLYEILGTLRVDLPGVDQGVLDSLADKVIAGQYRMMEHKRCEWERRRLKTRAIVEGHVVVNTEKYMADGLPKDPAVAAALLTVLLMNLVFHLSRRATSILLAGMKCMLLARGQSADSDKLPDDPRTVINRFDLDPRCSSFLQCPACYALYPYTGTITPAPPELEKCTHRPTPTSSLCNFPLWEERKLGMKTFFSPRRKYIHQSLKEWVGRLLTRPGVEEMLREPCDRPETPFMEDIWDAPVLRNFRDVDGKPFFRGRRGELRLAFSLNADGFHPLHKLEAKQTMSCTAIYMVLLNFPPTHRYLFRNMYLAGVIPGPGKPSLDQINHALSLLVSELLDFWKGVFYTMTFASSGLLTKGAMIPLVCDMLAARQLCGLSSATSTLFCTCCLLPIQEIENVDKSSWPHRDLGKQIEQAQRWRDCESEEDRTELFREYGARWSVLLELPYWNPILFAVVDSMHAAYLGLSQSHSRKFWRINLTIEGGDGSVIREDMTTLRPSDQVLSHWLTVIRDTDVDGLDDALKNCKKDALWHICIDNDIRSAGTRKQLISNIIKWRSCVEPDSIKLPDPSTDNDDESDGSENPGGAGNRFQQKIADTVEAFIKYKITERGLLRLRNDTLQAMCESNQLGVGNSKEELVQLLIDWRESNHPSPPIPESRDVLGRVILEAVWDDMTRTELPSWMSPAPRNWGSTKRGKLTADQWKVVTTVHLPITLMRLWGTSREGRYFLMLCNFMDLNAAIQLANQRIIAEKHIEDYERLISRYISGLMVIFKDTQLQPIHHVSMHAGDFLRLFGPTHSVRTPGFERFNEKLGLQNTNQKSGELEATFTMTACRAANLEWIMQDKHTRDSVQLLVEEFSRISGEDHRGTRLADEAHFPPSKPPKMVTLNHHTQELLQQLLNSTFVTSNASPHTSSALELEKISISGVIYSSEKSLPRDSNVIFRRPGDLDQRVGRIKSIFQVSHQPEATFVTVAQHKLIANSEAQNVYRRFGFAGGFLCDAREDGRLFVIRSEDIVCHFAKTTLHPIEGNLIHVLPLNTKMMEYQIPEEYDLPRY